MKTKKEITYTIKEDEYEADFYIIGINSYVRDYILASILYRHLKCPFQLYKDKEKAKLNILPFDKEDNEHAIYGGLKSGKTLVLLQNNNIMGDCLFSSFKVFEYLLIIPLPSTYAIKIQKKLEALPDIFFSSILPKEQINKRSASLAEKLINLF